MSVIAVRRRACPCSGAMVRQRHFHVRCDFRVAELDRARDRDRAAMQRQPQTPPLCTEPRLHRCSRIDWRQRRNSRRRRRPQRQTFNRRSLSCDAPPPSSRPRAAPLTSSLLPIIIINNQSLALGGAGRAAAAHCVFCWLSAVGPFVSTSPPLSIQLVQTTRMRHRRAQLRRRRLGPC